MSLQRLVYRGRANLSIGFRGLFEGAWRYVALRLKESARGQNGGSIVTPRKVLAAAR